MEALTAFTSRLASESDTGPDVPAEERPASVVSELHFMYSIVLGEGETSAQVLLQQQLLLVLLDVLDQLGVHGGLGLGAASVDLLLALAGVEEVSARGLPLAVGEGLVGHGLDVHAGGAHRGRGRDRVDLVDASERHAVHLVGSCHEQETRLELLEENDALATESSRGEDEDGSSCDALAKLGSLSLLCADLSLLVFGRVPIEFFDH